MNAEQLKNDPRFGTKSEFDDFFASTVKWAESCLADGDTEDVMPKVLTVGRSRDNFEMHTNVYVIASGFNDERTKWETIRKLGYQAASDGFAPLMAALISEAWRAPEGPCQPKDNPQKIEIVMVSAVDCFRRWSRGASMAIRRRVDNTIQPGKLEEIEGGNFSMPLLEQFFVGSMQFMGKKLSGNSGTSQN